MNIKESIKPFDYQIKLRDHFKKSKKLWSWYSDDKNKQSFFDEWKKNLLKDSYRMTKESHSEIYNMIEEIKSKMEIPINITLYQEQQSYQNNVSIMFNNDEAHIIFSGSVLNGLDSTEIKAVLCHELHHYHLFNIENKEFEITDRIITNISNDQKSADIYRVSGKLYKLYTELYCDRGAYEIMGKIDPVISSLVKLNTGINKINIDSYLTQAEEILKNGAKSEKGTHPETFIRAKALDLWAKKEDDYKLRIDNFIQDKIEYENLNIFSQKKLEEITYKLICLLIKPNWNKTDVSINLAKSYFPNKNLSEEVNTDELFLTLQDLGSSSKKFLGYVLLDFSLVDPDQGNLPLGYALEIAESAGMINQFKTALKKEIKLTERKYKDLKDEAIKALNNISESREDSLYGE